MRTIACLTLVLALLAGGVVLADDKPATATTDKAADVKKVEKIDPAKMDGKELFRTYCIGCHAEDSEYGEYTPMSLIMDQWDEFYDDIFFETHKEVVSETTGGKTLPLFLTEDMLNKLRKFCVDHAADSEQPATCG